MLTQADVLKDLTKELGNKLLEICYPPEFSGGFLFNLDGKGNMGYNINMEEQDILNFKPNVETKAEFFAKKVKTAWEYVARTILQSDLSDAEKQQVIKYIQSTKYILHGGLNGGSGAFDPTGESFDKVVNAVYLSEEVKGGVSPYLTIEKEDDPYLDCIKRIANDKPSICLVHETFHAASSAISKHGFMIKVEGEEDKFLNRGITEAATTMFSNLAFGQVNAYHFPAYVLKVMCLRLGYEKAMAFYLRGDLQGLKEAISNEYGHSTTKIVDEMFNLFDEFSELSLKNGEKTIMINRQEDVQTAAGKILELYGCLISPELVNEGVVNPEMIVERAIEDLNFVEEVNKYYKFARDEEGNKIYILTSEEDIEDEIEKKAFLRNKEKLLQIGKEEIYKIASARTEAIGNAKKGVTDFIAQNFGADKIDFVSEIGTKKEKVDHGLVNSAFFSASSAKLENFEKYFE